MPLPAWAPVLTDGTVTLRAHRAQDVDGVLAQCRDPQMQRWTTVASPYELRHALDFIGTRQREWEAGRYLGFAVDVDGRFAGTVDLRLDGLGGARVGYGLGDWARGRGATARALRLLLPWGFEALRLDVVHWEAAVGNWASRRVAWSVGFRLEGTVRALVAERGRRTDGWVATLRRGDPLTPTHEWYDPPILSRGLAVLRPHRDDDEADMAQACADPLTQHWLPHLPTPYGAGDARAHLEQIREEHASGTGMYWAVATAGAPDPHAGMRGEVGLFGLGRGTSRAGELGYWAHPLGRGCGLTTNAVRLAARHALLPRDVGGLGLTRVLIRAAEGNLASQRVALAAGFRPAGRDRGAEVLRDGSAVDLLRFDLVAQECPA